MDFGELRSHYGLGVAQEIAKRLGTAEIMELAPEGMLPHLKSRMQAAAMRWQEVAGEHDPIPGDAPAHSSHNIIAFMGGVAAFLRERRAMEAHEGWKEQLHLDYLEARMLFLLACVAPEPEEHDAEEIEDVSPYDTAVEAAFTALEQAREFLLMQEDEPQNSALSHASASS